MLLRGLCAAILLFTLGVGSLATSASPATCGQEIVDDWFSDERVDVTYALACYRQALELLPEDAQAYSSAPDEINRALQAAIRSQESELSGARSSPRDVAGTPAGDHLDSQGLEAALERDERTFSGVLPTSDVVASGSPQGRGEDENADGTSDNADSRISGRANSIPTPLLGLGVLLLVFIAGGTTAAIRKRRRDRAKPGG